MNDTTARRPVDWDLSPREKAKRFVGELKERWPTLEPYAALELTTAGLFEADLRIHNRLIALERRLAELEQNKGIAYRGVHLDGDHYEAGDYVTRSGSLWCALEPTRSRPGTRFLLAVVCQKRARGMRTLETCRRELDVLLASSAEPVSEVSAVLCEDGATVMIYLELAETILARSFDWPFGVPFNETAVLAELARLSPSRAVH